MTIRLAVFDMAGTTVDDSGDAVATAVCEALSAAGHLFPLEAVNEVMGMPKPLAVAHLLRAGGEDPSDERIGAVHADFQQRMVRHYQTDPGVREFEGAEEAFAELRAAGIHVALDTGFDRVITDAILERLGWAIGEQIDDSITSDEVENGRPYPDMIYALAERCGVTDMQEVAKIGDSMSDIEQGVAAGCGLIAAIVGARTEEGLEMYQDVLAVRSLSEFVAAATGRSADAKVA